MNNGMFNHIFRMNNGMLNHIFLTNNGSCDHIFRRNNGLFGDFLEVLENLDALELDIMKTADKFNKAFPLPIMIDHGVQT